MTPKKKAKELVDKFSNAKSEDGYLSLNYFRHKQCALIAVDEIIQATLAIQSPYYWEMTDSGRYYWQEVKEEINKI